MSSGSVATYTATVTVPLSLTAGTTASDFTASITAAGMLQSTGTFQFNFGPRTVNWIASSGDFSGSGNWDVGFAPRTSDTASIANGGASTLSTSFTASPVAVWVGNGSMLTIATGGSLGCGAMVLGRSGNGTLVLGGGTLDVPSISQGGGSGTLYFNGGTLLATASNSQFIAGLSAAYVSTSGAFINTNGHNVTISQALLTDPALNGAPDGGLTMAGSGVLTLDATNTYTGGTTVSGGTLFANGPNSAHGALGDGNVTVKNGGTITVGGGNSFVGSQTSSAGTISIDAGGAIVNSGSSTNHLDVLLLDGGTLSATTDNPTFGNWNFDLGVVTPGNGSTSYISGGNAALTQAGGTVFNIGSGDTAIVATMLAKTTNAADTGLIKQGNGLLLLTASNTYASPTTISAGTLKLGLAAPGTNILPAATALAIGNSGTLDLGGGTQMIASLSGSGQVVNSAGTLAALIVSGSATATFSGNINDAGGGISLEKAGTGKLVLSGTDSFAGGTTVAGGTLIVMQSEGLADRSNLTVGSASFFAASVVSSPVGQENIAAAVVPVPEPGSLVLAAVLFGAAWAYRKAMPARRVASSLTSPTTISRFVAGLVELDHALRVFG